METTVSNAAAPCAVVQRQANRAELAAEAQGNLGHIDFDCNCERGPVIWRWFKLAIDS